VRRRRRRREGRCGYVYVGRGLLWRERDCGRRAAEALTAVRTVYGVHNDTKATLILYTKL
jgi:hypothetical protein